MALFWNFWVLTFNRLSTRLWRQYTPWTFFWSDHWLYACSHWSSAGAQAFLKDQLIVLMLKVSEKDFSLTGTFFVSCYWKDERIHWKSGYKLKSPHYVLHQNLASKFWSPRMRVGRYYLMETPFIWISHQIQHVKKSNNDAGRLYFQERFSLNNVSGVPLVDLDLMTRVEITCPMNFNWFPFDSQVC